MDLEENIEGSRAGLAVVTISSVEDGWDLLVSP